MRPFVQHGTNSLTSSASAPQHQVVGGANSMSPNLMQIQSQMVLVNPNLPNNNNGFNPNFVNGNTPSNFMNVPNIPNFNGLQNGQMVGSNQQIQSNSGFLPHNFGGLGFPVNGQLGNMSQGNPNQLLGHNSGQFGWQNQLQNMNQLGNMPLLNPSQVNALTQLLGCANQVAMAINQQNSTFVGNPQLGVGRPNGGLQSANFNQQLSVVSQPLPQLPNVSVPLPNPVSSSHMHGQSSNYQHNYGQKQGMQTSNSNHHRNNNFVNPNWRSHNSQGRKLHNFKGKHNFSNVKEEKGPENNTADRSKSGKKRSLAMFYTEKEIQQWREERKKNFPSKINVEKKLTQKQANDAAAAEAAKIRRQQLKEVLAKQAELGFEVPEIPSHYLLDRDHLPQGRDNYRRPYNKGRFPNNGRFQNKFNRDGKFDRKDRFAKRRTEDDGSFRKHDRFTKRPRLEDDDSSKTPLSVKEPTLLQKLLSSDIKKDKSRLLQAFRFMVINSFFKDWPDKPLNFPEVIVKESGVDSDVIEDKACVFEGELSNNEDDDTFVENNGENVKLPEEGEITD